MKDSKKIVVISDTHKNISNAIDVILSEKPDYVLHLGDCTDDCDELKRIFSEKEIIGVCGNCDWSSFSSSPVERMLDVCGVKILMCHGHTYSVKSGIGSYMATAEVKGADIALFGHTHVPLLDNRGYIALMNPGTISTYGVIEIRNGKFDMRICDFKE